MAITQQQLSDRFKAALDLKSDDPNVNIQEARQQLADDLAAAVNDFVVGRLVNVTGVQTGPGAAVGTIESN